MLHFLYANIASLVFGLKWSCHGGLTRELMTLTGVDDHSKWRAALEGVCEGAFERVAVENIENGSWDRFTEANIDIEDYFQGKTVLNNELGNLQQQTSEFER